VVRNGFAGATSFGDLKPVRSSRIARRRSSALSSRGLDASRPEATKSLQGRSKLAEPLKQSTVKGCTQIVDLPKSPERVEVDGSNGAI
jgi:hypothetical protein